MEGSRGHALGRSVFTLVEKQEGELDLECFLERIESFFGAATGSILFILD